MVSLNRILCPVDFSDSSRRALQYAAAMGKWYGARVTALHVFPNLPVIDAVPLYRGQPLSLHDTDPDALRATLTAFVADAAEGTPVICELVEGTDVRHETLRVARAIAADVIVMATHGRSGVEGLLLGSVAEKVVKAAGCPVMLIPPGAVRDGSPIEVPFTRILCAVDFAEQSAPAVTLAIELAEEADAHLTLLHAIEVPAELQVQPVGAEAVDIPAVRAAADAAARQRLRELVPAAARTYCKVHTDVRQGRPSRAILHGAHELSTTLIVMGIHGRNAFDRLIFGSNTHAVLRGAHCPVLTVPTVPRAAAVGRRRVTVSAGYAKAS